MELYKKAGDTADKVLWSFYSTFLFKDCKRVHNESSQDWVISCNSETISIISRVRYRVDD